MARAEDANGLMVLVVLEHENERVDLVDMLGADPRIDKVWSVADSVGALRFVNDRHRLNIPLIDAVYLDTHIRPLDGIEFARVLGSMPNPPACVLVSAHDDQAANAYEVNADDYLLKPIRAERLAASIDRIVVRRRYHYLPQFKRLDGSTPFVFLCHASGDKGAVRALRDRLVDDHFDCWFDEDDLLPGQEWESEISQAIRRSAYVLACISHTSITKRGYIQKELKTALDVADEQPEGATFLIPVRLEPCAIPQRLQRWQWVDLFAEGGYERLTRSMATLKWVSA